MKRKPFSLRLTMVQIVRLSLASYLLTVAALVAIRYAGGAWIGHGAVPAWTWLVALLVPVLDLLLGLGLWHGSRRLQPARPLLFSGLVLAAFAAWTLWTWR